jgi:hypothetical protein
MKRRLFVNADGFAHNEEGILIGRVHTQEGRGKNLFVWREGHAYVVTDSKKAMLWELAGVYSCEVDGEQWR